MFLSLSHLALGKAVTGSRDLTRDIARDLRANGEPFPETLSSKTGSGTFVVSIPAEPHRRL